ncbi:MAG: ribose ABC transporter substrate-binding protein RbsB [Clostridiales bacterium]|uniref:ribose ABC transporter substrate-binding protein RbsB n=2 Tax=Terrisporobacter sp. TaxID=1965305 RepID=UPI002A41E602|nr:ribose ABC transporter substrate-binding protein RbsB [Terrisporobacter sp.]MCI5629224.1 ribose ABC transporter substrate-binding protein RbsB [Clostridium sp.]MDD5879890.1 ribose ABC transporter substrate-binding protein RbsB [Clostridiales bacterium]MDD7754380.1 ribose ABC transporter substrate-binding protein RbsB [Clostridiales bacterium]MDY4137580.1 ribose ABC transporter substrate-binding protein RbsB [Terrisporobacter sp.]MDY4736288.1 ribose ABC transporter substrate-binding protein 
MLKKLATLTMSFVLCSSLLVGCGKNTNSDTQKIGLIVSTLNNPFFVDLKTGIENQAKKLGYDVVVLDSQNDPAKEVSNMEDISVKDVDVVLLNPVDSDSAIASVMVANNLDLPVITVDRAANGGEVVSHVASDNAEGGKMAAQYLINQLGDNANIVELEGIAGSSATRDRGAGFDNEIENSNLNIITKQSADFDRTKGLSVMENIIQSKGDIDAVFAQNDEMALGALKALQDANMDNVLVVGFDATDDAVASVNKGEMSATIAQQPILIGETAVNLTHRFLSGETVEAFAPVELKLISK